MPDFVQKVLPMSLAYFVTYVSDCTRIYKQGRLFDTFYERPSFFTYSSSY